MLNMFEREILQRIYGRTQEGGHGCPIWNSELYSLYNEPNIVEDIKTRLGWAGHIIRMEEERIPKRGFKWKLPHHKTSGKTKNQMGGCGPEGSITTAGDKRIRGWRRRAENRDEWRHLIREAKARKGLQRHMQKAGSVLLPTEVVLGKATGISIVAEDFGIFVY